jgi:TATA-box binding protein (TBP) (component of TFIID and TFIIIB)
MIELSPPRNYLRPHTQQYIPIFNQWVEYPPKCVNISNYVTRAALSEPIKVSKFAKELPFCKMNVKNWDSASLATQYPYRFASIYDTGIIKFSGASSLRASRAITDRYVDLMRSCGYPNIRVLQSRAVNIGCCFNFDFALDIKAYNETMECSVYLADNFVGSRDASLSNKLVSNATVTVFTNGVNIVGATSERDVCFDIERLHRKYELYKLPDGAEQVHNTRKPQKQQNYIKSESKAKKRKNIESRSVRVKRLKI